MTIAISPFIRTVIKLDIAIGVVTALAFIFGGSLLAGLTAIPQQLLFWAGIVLVAYVGLLIAVVGRESVSRMLMFDLVVINIAWSALSFGLLAAGMIAPNALGIALDIVQAVVIAGFALVYGSTLRAKSLEA